MENNFHDLLQHKGNKNHSFVNVMNYQHVKEIKIMAEAQAIKRTQELVQLFIPEKK